MIKAVGKHKGRTKLLVGLSFGNLDRFREAPLDTFIEISGKETGLPFDVVIFSGETEAEMTELVSKGFGPHTKITVDARSKN